VGGSGTLFESAARMIDKLRQSRGWQFLLVSSLILLIPLMADISGRMSTLHRMHQEKARLTHELEMASAEHDILLARLESVSDDAYVERWARVDARMTVPGDVAFIPLAPEDIRPTFTSFEKRLPRPQPETSIAEQWRRFFLEDESEQ
jgi:cell division protein FtsB